MSGFKQLVFSGVQPTGNLQLGNYLGAIKKWVALQQQYTCLFCVVDMHALTVNPNPEDLLQQTREVAASFLAAGINPDEHIIFNQSQVPQHAELAWVFNCVARMGWLSRMTQFKDKTGKNSEKASVGLFAYPSLMAADILIYRATHVPVGEDQRQHLELTRDIAQKFNADYAERIAKLKLSTDLGLDENSDKNAVAEGYFPYVEPLISKDSMRIMSLRDGTKKMSKSDPSDMSRINLTDDADSITKKIRKARTDSEPLPQTLDGLEGRAEADNLIGIYAGLTDIDKQSALNQFSGKAFSEFKPALIEALVEKLVPVGEELKRLMQAPDYIDTVLHKGSQRAAERAEATMKDVQDIVGFLRS